MAGKSKAKSQKPKTKIWFGLGEPPSSCLDGVFKEQEVL
jgi:hypothetical protein